MEKQRSISDSTATADSLTRRSLHGTLTLMKRMQMAGNKPIALIGGGTTMIGDPSGRTDMRKMLTRERRSTTTAECFKQSDGAVSSSSAREKLLMLNNADWLLNLNYVELLREVGACFSVNNMLPCRVLQTAYGKRSFASWSSTT